MTNEERREAQRAQYLKMPRAKLAELMLDRDEALDRERDRVGDLSSELRRLKAASEKEISEAKQEVILKDARMKAMRREIEKSRTREAITFGRLVELRGTLPSSRALIDPGSLDREAYAYLDRLFDRPAHSSDGFSYGDDKSWDNRR